MAYNDEHIFQLILEKLSGEISDENRLYLEQAAREDEKIRRCLEEMEDASKKAGPGFMDDVYNEIAWSNVLSLLDNDQPPSKIVTVKEPIPVPSPKKLNHRTWWIAAAVLLAISALIYFLPSGTHSSFLHPFANNRITIPLHGDVQLFIDNGDTLQLKDYDNKAIALTELIRKPVAGVWATLVVPVGKDYKMLLPDGSVVQLNAFSSLRFPLQFPDAEKEVFLSGEAYFTVAPDAQRAFVVHSGQTVVKVLGTSFNVKAYSDSLIVTSLVQGSVITQENNLSPLQLKPGMESVYHSGYPAVIQNFDENVTLAWRKGQYNYYNESLGELDAVILHWYGKQLLFDNATLAARKITGIIERDKPLTEFLDGLGRTSGLAYEIDNDKVYLSEK
jgi:transmembrane sensor